MRSTFNSNLPDKFTICAWYANSDCSSAPGINVHTLKNLELKATEKKSAGGELVCSLSVDEMAIRRQIQWCGSQKLMLGYPTYMNDSSSENLIGAKQAITFLLCGINERFQLPFAYHFVSSMNGAQRADLLKEICTAITGTGTILLNVTSDGLAANDTMCVNLGANFQHTRKKYTC